MIYSFDISRSIESPAKRIKGKELRELDACIFVSKVVQVLSFVGVL